MTDDLLSTLSGEENATFMIPFSVFKTVKITSLEGIL